MLYSTFETSKIKMDAVFNIGYEAAKNRLKKLSLYYNQDY
jgi:NTE family protein